MKSAQENLLQQQDSQVETIHQFSLKPLDQKAYISNTVVVNFTPQISESKIISIAPRLCKSKDCFQPLFESPYIKNLLQVNGQIPDIYLSMKQGPSRTPISQRSSQCKSDQHKPKPTSKYCQVCKQKFNEDYLDHIKHIVHVNNLKANPFQKYIQSLIQDFKKNNKRDTPPRSTFKEQNGLGKARKKIKQDITFNFPINTYKKSDDTAKFTESTNNSSVHIEQGLKTHNFTTFKE